MNYSGIKLIESLKVNKTLHTFKLHGECSKEGAKDFTELLKVNNTMS
jgi:hypothetical protein